MVQRLEKFLESTGIKLSGVVTQLMGASSRAMLDALVAGECDPEVLTSYAKGSLSKKTAVLAEALRASRFGDHHAFMIGELLTEFDSASARIARLDARSEEAIAPFRDRQDAFPCCHLTTLTYQGWTLTEALERLSGAASGWRFTALYWCSPEDPVLRGRLTRLRFVARGVALRGAHAKVPPRPREARSEPPVPSLPERPNQSRP